GIPGITGGPAEPLPAVGESAGSCLAEQHGAGLAEHDRHTSIGFRNPVTIRLGTPGGCNTRRVEYVLQAVRNSVQRAAIAAGGQFLVHRARLPPGEIRADGDVALELRREPFDALEVEVG